MLLHSLHGAVQSVNQNLTNVVSRLLRDYEMSESISNEVDGNIACDTLVATL